MARGWGPWTRIKLDALDRYLSGFTTASQRARGTLYLDLFAGDPENFDRETYERIVGSPGRALATRPSFSKLAFCELDTSRAAALEARLRAEFPGRDFDVLPGDCNEKMPAFLQELDSGWRRAPTFAFIDQFSAEISWETIRYLATWKSNERKIEQWTYFGDSFIPRGLVGPQGSKNLAYAARVDRMFGDPITWRKIWAAKEDGVLSADQARDELVNLWRWQLREQLGYTFTLPLEVPNRTGQTIYRLIFATDHEVGDKIMRSVFEGADQDFEAMVAAHRAKKAKRSLFGDDDDSLFDAVPLFVPRAGPKRPPLIAQAVEPREPFDYWKLWGGG